MHVTQPAATKILMDIEEILEARLFDRLSRGMLIFITRCALVSNHRAGSAPSAAAESGSGRVWRVMDPARVVHS